MKSRSHVCSTLLAALLSGPALAADAPAASASGPSARQLAGLCDTCVLVTATRVDTRKGKGSGAGAVGGAVVGGVVGNKVGDGGTVSTGVGAVERRLRVHRSWPDLSSQQQQLCCRTSHGVPQRFGASVGQLRLRRFPAGV